jgi:hypothetical protein
MAIAAAMRVIFVASRWYAEKHLRNRFKLSFHARMARICAFMALNFPAGKRPLHFRKLAIALFRTPFARR